MKNVTLIFGTKIQTNFEEKGKLEKMRHFRGIFTLCVGKSCEFEKHWSEWLWVWSWSFISKLWLSLDVDGCCLCWTEKITVAESKEETKRSFLWMMKIGLDFNCSTCLCSILCVLRSSFIFHFNYHLPLCSAMAVQCLICPVKII